MLIVRVSDLSYHQALKMSERYRKRPALFEWPDKRERERAICDLLTGNQGESVACLSWREVIKAKLPD